MTSLCNLAWSALGVGDREGATAHLNDLTTQVLQTGDPHYERVGLLIAGDLSCARGDFENAHAHYARVFESCQGDRWLAADAIIGFAGIFAHIGLMDRAARLFGAAEALYAEFGVPFPPRNRPAFDTWVRLIRDELGEDRSREEWSIGKAMSTAGVAALSQELATLLQKASADVH
ncbi:MAG: hypothetical protein C4346_01645 [Chloroflexota bacterium]